MFKWIQHFQTVTNDLSYLLSARSVKELELKIESYLESLSTNPKLINSLSLVLNTQSQVKSLLNFGLEKVWKNIQLPNKKDQERTLYLLHELQFKLFEIEKELARTRRPVKADSSDILDRPRESKISVLDKKPSPTRATKLV